MKINPRVTKVIPILQVEDDENDMILLDYAARDSNCHIHINCVPSAKAAMAYLQREGKYQNPNTYPAPLLVLLDLKLNDGYDGFELLRWIRGRPETRDLVVIIFSSSAEPRDIALGYTMGANSYVAKPSSYEERKEFLQALHNWWCIWNEYLP